MQQKHLTWMMVLCVVGVLIVGTGALLALGILHPTFSLTAPRAVATATPAPIGIETVNAFSPTPAPAATATPAPTHAQYPSNAVNLIVNGTPLMAVSNRDAAARLLEEYLAVCAAENLSETEHLIRAYIDAELSTTPVDGTVPYYSYDEAKNRLLSNRTLIPVVRSVERAELGTGTVESTEAEQPALPVGTRVIRSLGKAEHTLCLVETLYKSGIAVSASQTLAQTRVGSEPMPCVIENGVHVYPEQSTEGAAAAGDLPVGRDAGELQFLPPCRGKVQSGFGMRYGTMHYGVDYTLRPGDTITAPESGTVIFIGERGDYGLVIDIRHAGGFVSRLTHCANPSVELEQHVYRGDPIASLERDENEAQPHLHYELLIDGIPFDPLQYMK